MEQKIYFPGRISKFMLHLRIINLRAMCGLSGDLPFDWRKETRTFMVSYHNQLIDTYQVNTRIFEYVR